MIIISRTTNFFSRQITSNLLDRKSSSLPIRQLIYWSTYIRCEAPIHLVPEVKRVCPYKFDKFSMVTVDEVRKCVVKLTSKSCDLDPLSGYVTRKALGTLIPFIYAPSTSLRGLPQVMRSFQTLTLFQILLSSAKQLRSRLLTNWSPILTKTRVPQFQYLVEEVLVQNSQTYLWIDSSHLRQSKRYPSGLSLLSVINSCQGFEELDTFL